MKRLALVVTTLAICFGCEEEDPCDRYADYVCACHEGEEDFDCEALLELAEAPSQDVADQCAIDLDSQKEVDDEAGLVCEV
jgi:hypothetical protein